LIARSASASDPDRAYQRWIAHLERCQRCAAAGELQLERLCAEGLSLIGAWLLAEEHGHAA
jgi:hypothetical protein